MAPPRIAIVTLGTRGDVEPFVHVAAALQSAGAAVLLVTHESYAAFVESHGVAFASLGPGMLEERAATPEGKALGRASGTALMAAAKAFMRVVGKQYWAGARAALEAFHPDLAVLSTLSGFFHSSLCEALRVRCVVVAHMCPLVPTGAWAPPLGLPFASAPLAVLNRWLWRVTTRMGWSLVYREGVEELRASAGLGPLPDAGGPYASADGVSFTIE